MVVVGVAVALVDGDVELVSALDKVQALDIEDDLPFAADLLGLVILHMGVRAVARDAVGAVQPDAEDEIVVRLVRTDSEMDGDRLARLKDVRRLAVFGS